MTRDQFIEILKEKGYDYHNEGERIIVDHEGYIFLNNLTSLPSGIEFRNGGEVGLRSLTSLPPDVQFRNRGHVLLHSLTNLPSGVEFKNSGYVWLPFLTSLPAGVQFRNGENVWLNSLNNLPDDVQFNNGGNILLRSIKILPIEDMDYLFQNSGYVYIEHLSMKDEFSESKWKRVDKRRRVKTFEGFTSDI
jgi:hypothetical protein